MRARSGAIEDGELKQRFSVNGSVSVTTTAAPDSERRFLRQGREDAVRGDETMTSGAGIAETLIAR